MFRGCRWPTRTFNSHHKFSMGLRSGDWLGHSRTLKCFYRAPPLLPGRCVWDHCHAGRSSHVSSSRLSLMEGGFGLKSHNTWPRSLFPQHGSVFLPLCIKTAPKHDVSSLGCNFAFFFLQTRRVEFLPKSSILVSSDHMIFSQSYAGSSTCSLANFRRAWTCTGLSRGTRLALQDLSPSLGVVCYLW